MIRTLRLVLVTVLLAAGLIVVPAPTVVWAEELETLTRPLGLERARSVEAAGLVRESPFADDHDDASRRPAGRRDLPSPLALQGGDARVDTFTAIGVTLDVEPEGEVAFRVRESGGWGPWRQLSFSEDHAPEGEEAAGATGGITSDPFVVGRATGYDIQVPPNVGDAKVHLVTVTDRRVRISVDDDEADAGTPRIRRRSEWGARPYSGTPSEAPKLSMAVVHHSAGASDESTASILRSIQAYHMDGHGWSDIGYNFAVDQAGRIWEARQGGVDRAIIGAHANGFNTGSTGVVVLGDYDAAAPTTASLTAVQQIISWKFARHHVVSSGTHVYRPGIRTKFGPEGTEIALPRILGHRDIGTTSCPGANVHSRLGEARTWVPRFVPGDEGVVPARVFSGRWNGDAREDVMMYRPGGVEDSLYLGSGLIGGPSFAAGSVNVNGLYEPITGDFDGDGISDVVWYGDRSRSDHVWFGATTGWDTSKAINVGGSYEPFVGDFDGDGRSDVFWLRPYGGADYIWYGRADRSFESRRVQAPTGQPEPLVGDFDGDGRDDVFFYRVGSSPDGIWYGGSRGTFDRSRSVNVKGHYRPIVGDFTGNGRDDVFWYKPGSGPDSMWIGGADRSFESRTYTVNGRFDPFVGDFDGNGYDDIFWSRTSGSDYQWMFRSGGSYRSADDNITSSFRTDGLTLSGPYLTVLDADADGRDEILAQEHPSGGRLWYWSPLFGVLSSRSVG